jgi:hypothetical protein
MPSGQTEVVVLKKNGDRHTTTMPDDGLMGLYKRCGFKKPEGFEERCSWALPCDGVSIFIKAYGKLTGRAGSENKSELPPPVDTLLFFGNIAIVAFMGNDIATAKPTTLSATRFEKLYEILIGGVEDLGGTAADRADAEEDADEEAAAHPGVLLPRTAAGYAKDGFVVEDDDDDETGEDGSDEDSELSSLTDDEEQEERGSDGSDDGSDDEDDLGAESVVRPGDELHPDPYDSE